MCQRELCKEAQDQIKKIVDLLMPEAPIEAPFHYETERKRSELSNAFSKLALLANGTP